MSATNTTTNYNLPIFIGSDKPAWLVDFNGAMNAIDAQMKVNADAIATKSPILTFNDTTEIDFTKSGDIITANLTSGVSDKVGRALVTPIAPPAAEQLVGINTSGVQTNLTIGSGLYNNSGTLEAIDLNLSTIETAICSISSGNLPYATIRLATNADKSVGKIYGSFNASQLTSGRDYTISTNLTVAATGEAYTISPMGLMFYGFPINQYNPVNISISATGQISINFTAAQAGSTNAYIFPSLLFFKSFGDVPAPTPTP